MAVTLVCPAALKSSGPNVVMFGWPGGGYNRRYYDLPIADGSAYSQAAFHAERGAIFVSCDHPGVGGSDSPASAFSHEDTARVNAAAARAVLDGLKAGTLDPRIPPLADIRAFGMGQSYGGLLLTVLQAQHALFEGVAFLGWSGICTEVKGAPGDPPVPALADIVTTPAVNDGLRHPFRRAFHFDDVPEEIVAEDMRGYPFRFGLEPPVWASVHMPGGPNFRPERGPLGPNVVVEEAASITAPVFIGAGEIDTLPDPHAEASAYRASRDVTMMIIPRAAHMHNFAGTRRMLWARLHAWAQTIARDV
ncbi:MAG: hypothetical protein ACOYM8_12575 [Caulobacterales bacterium]